MWESIIKKLETSSTLKSRTGTEYKIKSFDAKGFTLSRMTSTSTVRITRRRVEDTEKRLRAGEALKFQRNKSQGGISYTVAEEAGVVWALEEIIDIDTANRVYKFSINQGVEQ